MIPSTLSSNAVSFFSAEAQVGWAAGIDARHKSPGRVRGRAAEQQPTGTRYRMEMLLAAVQLLMLEIRLLVLVHFCTAAPSQSRSQLDCHFSSIGFCLKAVFDLVRVGSRGV